MKILAYTNSEAFEYRGFEVYYDDKTGDYYFYNQPKGQDRRNFESDKAAEEYIDKMYDRAQPEYYPDEMVDYWRKRHNIHSARDLSNNKKYILTYRISQVWYEDGKEVDRDTWEETRTTRRADNEVMAQAIVETKLEKEYGCNTKAGPWELELECIDIKEK